MKHNLMRRTKNIGKRLASLVLGFGVAVTMLGGVIPISTYAAGINYGVWVDGVRVTDENADDVLEDGTVSYNAETETLTLNGANLTQVYNNGIHQAVIYANDTVSSFKINVEGQNTITANAVEGIYAMNSILFAGTGALDVSIKNNTASVLQEGYAVYSHIDNVTITSGTYSFYGYGTSGWGIMADSNSGTVYVNGGTLITAGDGTNTGTAIGAKLDLSSYAGCEVTASVNADGEPELEYDPNEQNTFRTYKYIKVMPQAEPVYDENGFQVDGRGYQPAESIGGVYQIQNAGNLFWFAELLANDEGNANANAKLTKDITIPADRNWKPIAAGTYGMSYQGTFDGDEHTISNLTVRPDSASSMYISAGLFKTIGNDGVVKNLGMINASVKPNSGYAGAICGTNSGLIENCFNLGGEISVNIMWAGGIAGRNEGTIKQCYNTGSVINTTPGADGAGGICGFAYKNSIIENCYNTGMISSYYDASGIAGYYTDAVTISNCYNTGSISATDGSHKIAFYYNPSGSTAVGDCVENSYYLSEDETSDGGRTAAQFASGEVAWLLNEESSAGVWKQTLGGAGKQDLPAFAGETVYAGYEFCYSTAISFSNDSAQVSPTKPAHNFSKLAYDGENHWYVCSNQGCTEINGKEKHGGGSASYFKKAVCTVCEQEYGALLTDTTAPTGEITIGTNSWKDFSDAIIFGLFFQDTQSVTITANDDSYSHEGFTADKEVAIAYYLYSGDTALTKEELDHVAFTAYTGGFDITPDNRYTIYAKITDHAGNVTYISSGGIVLDGTDPTVSGIESGATYYTTQEVTVLDDHLESVTLNGEPVKNMNRITLAGDTETVYTIVAVDKAGNESTITVTMKPIASLAEAITGLAENNVTSDDTSAVEDVLSKVSAVDTTDATDAEKAALQEIQGNCAALLDKISGTAAEIQAVTDGISGYVADTVKSTDQVGIETLLGRIDALTAANNLTDEETALLKDLQNKGEALLSVIEDAAASLGTDAIKEAESIHKDNVALDDREALEDALNDLEAALADNAGNYTEEEMQAAQEQIDRLEAALEVITHAENVLDKIHALPTTAQPDDTENEAAAKDAKAAYDALTDYEKTLIGEQEAEKLQQLLAALADYRIIEGAGSIWTIGDTATLRFKANGALSKFTGIQVDGKEVDPSGYTAENGSTVLTLKADFLNTLSAGQHTLTVLYADGAASADFTVETKAEDGTTSPQTDAGSALWLWLALLFVSGGAALCLSVKSKRTMI